MSTPLAGTPHLLTLFKFLPLHSSPSNRLYNFFITVYCLFFLLSDLLPTESSIMAGSFGGLGFCIVHFVFPAIMSRPGTSLMVIKICGMNVFIHKRG